MKKIVSILAAVATLLSVTSCDKENGAGVAPEQPSMDGAVKISVVVPGNAKDSDTRAFTPSTVRPKTTWANVNSMMIIFVNSANQVVEVARELSATDLTQLKTGAATTIANAPQGTYDVYLVANGLDKTASQLTRNTPIASVEASLMAMVVAPAETNGSFGEAKEIFVAKQAGIVIGAGAPATPTAFSLERIISLLRARVDTKPYTTAGAVLSAIETEIEAQNANLEFDGIRIRRATSVFHLNGTYTPADGARGVICNAGPFKTVNPTAADYTSDNADFNFTTLSPFWNEYKIYPAGSTEVNKAFHVVLESTVKAGVTYKDASGATQPAGTKIYFAATLTKAIAANQILEVLFNLKGIGGVDVPPLVTYGDLEISATVVNWGAIIGEDVEI